VKHFATQGNKSSSGNGRYKISSVQNYLTTLAFCCHVFDVIVQKQHFSLLLLNLLLEIFCAFNNAFNRLGTRNGSITFVKSKQRQENPESVEENEVDPAE
jgi:hypothetical protein